MGRVLTKSSLVAWAASASAVAGLAAYGFDFGIVNNEFHAAFVYPIAGTASLHGDALAASMGHFTSPFWWVVALVCKYVAPPTVFLAFLLLARFTLAYGLGNIAMALTAGRWRQLAGVAGAVLSLSPAFIRDLPLGRDPVFDTYLSQTFFSVGICLLALSAGLTRRRVLAWGLAGLAYDVNAMQANFVLGALGCLLLHEWVWKRSVGVRQVLASAAAFVLIASPTIVWIALVMTAKPVDGYLAGSSLVDYAKFYFPGHYFFLNRSFWDQSRGVSLVLLPVVLAMAAAPRLRVRLLIVSVVLALYIPAEAAFQTLGPTRLFFQLHLLRSDVISYCLAVSAACAALIRESRRGTWRWPVYGAVLGALLVHDFRAGLLAALVAAGGTVVERLRPVAWSRYVDVAVRACPSALGALLLAVGSPLVPGVLLVATPVLQAAAIGPAVRKSALAVCLVLTAMALTTDGAAIVNRKASTRADSTEAIGFYDRASEILPADALVVVPPQIVARPHLKRSVYVSFSEGAAYLWQTGYERDYLRRLSLVGIPYTPGVKPDSREVGLAYQHGMPTHIDALRHEGVTHLVIDPAVATELAVPCLIRSAHFCLAGIPVASLHHSVLGDEGDQ